MTARPLIRLVLAGLLALGAACARGGASPASDAGAANRLLVGLGVEGGSGPTQTTVRVGQPITLVLFLENRGTAPARITYRSGQRYDFTVSRDGRAVWHWSQAAGVAFTQALVEAEVAPGERLVYREVFRGLDTSGQPLPPGAYEARGTLPITPRPLETPPLVLTLEPPG